MERPISTETKNGNSRTDVKLRDYSKLVNVERLDINDDSIFEAVEDGECRVYSFIFKTRPEFESFADRYVQASIPIAHPNNGEDGSDADTLGDDDGSGSTSEAEEEDSEDNSAAIIDGASQDLTQLYYNNAAVTKAMKGLDIQSSIEEEDAESSSS